MSNDLASAYITLASTAENAQKSIQRLSNIDLSFFAVFSTGAQSAETALMGLSTSLNSTSSAMNSYAVRLGASTVAAIAAFSKSIAASIVPKGVSEKLDSLTLKIGTSLLRMKGTMSGALEGVKQSIVSKVPGWVQVLGESARNAAQAFSSKFNISKHAESESTGSSRAFAKIRFAASALGGAFKSAGMGIWSLTGPLRASMGEMMQTGSSAAVLGANVKQACNESMQQMMTFITNLPVMAQSLAMMLPQMVQQITAAIPAFVSALSYAMGSIMSVIPALLPQVIQGLTELLIQLVPLMVTLAPFLVQAGLQLFTGLIQALDQVMLVLLPTLPGLLTNICNVLIENLPLLLTAAIQLFTSLINGFTQMVPVLIPLLPQMILSICTTLIENLPLLLEAALTLFMALVTAFINMLPALIEMLPTLIVQVTGKLLEFMPRLLEAGRTLFMKICEAVPTILTSLGAALWELLQSIPPKIIEFAPQIANAAFDMIAGMVNGIKDVAGWIIDTIGGLCGDVLGAIKGFFGIASPSRVMRQMFNHVGEGMVLGLGDQAGHLADEMQSMLDGAEAVASGFAPDLNLGMLNEQNSRLGGRAVPAAYAAVAASDSILASDESARSLMKALSVQNAGVSGVSIHDCTFVVRKESDIDAIAGELYQMIGRETRGRL